MRKTPSNINYNYAYAPVSFSGGKVYRDAMYITMRENNILCRKYWYPLITEHNVYKNSVTDKLINAKK